ncbi:MerR family transcriptional regulator [Paraflavisolibacter sp. H34]|uniref:MerR family transcriptional regulator n=1 Tax=Huijunlia imazamoxiresistens TaxID=3127457 RepID=UPI0030181330
MQYFAIKDIENLCGIKAHTLRIWEQRYDFFQPKRKGTAHRIYDNDDLKQLLRISFLYHNGWKISKIAALDNQGILEEVRKAEVTPSNYPLYLLQLLEAAVDFNEARFTGLMDEISRQVGFDKCIVEVCYPYLQKVGMLWVTNRVIPAQEHFSSYIIQNKIIAETEKLKAVEGAPRMVLFSPEGEFHELPLLFLNYLLRKGGRNVIYLGKNIRRDVLREFKEDASIHYLFLHLITNFTGLYADEYFEELCRTFPDKTIVASGTVVHDIQRPFMNLKLLKSDKEILEFVNAS